MSPAHFWFGPAAMKYRYSKFGNVELVIAVPFDLLFAYSNYRYPILPHQSTDTAMVTIEVDLFRLFCHPWAPITTQADGRTAAELQDDLRTIPDHSYITLSCSCLAGLVYWSPSRPAKASSSKRSMTCPCSSSLGWSPSAKLITPAR